MSETRLPFKRTVRRFSAILLGFTVCAAGIVVTGSLLNSPGQLGMFNGGVPGTPEALAALKFAHENHIDQIINYSVINAAPKARDDYLVEADHLGVSIIVSIKDLLGATDLDPPNAAFHQYYGNYVHPELKLAGQTPTIDQQVEGIVKLLDPYPAVGGYYISDELPQDPTGPESLAKWRDPLQHRYAQIHSLSHKPTKVSLYWTAGTSRVEFMRDVKQWTDELMVDYYPFPEGAGHRLGPLAEIGQAGAAISSSAGAHGWFIFQAFSWDVEPATAANLGFAPGSPAPDAAAMVNMARRAVKGGARNLALFSYEYMTKTPGQTQEVRLALSKIRTMKGFE